MRDFVRSGLAVIVFVLLFFDESKVYDLATAMFFAVGLGLMARVWLDEYFVLFAFGSLNRETMVLLMLIFAIYFFGRMGWRAWCLCIGYQGLIFVAVRACLTVMFAEAFGEALWWRTFENLSLMAEHPWWSLAHWCVFAGACWWCVRGWRRKPLILRIAFTVLVPILTAFYLVLGWMFEVRVFAEVFPVAWAMGMVNEEW